AGGRVHERQPAAVDAEQHVVPGVLPGRGVFAGGATDGAAGGVVAVPGAGAGDARPDRGRAGRRVGRSPPAAVGRSRLIGAASRTGVVWGISLRCWHRALTIRPTVAEPDDAALSASNDDRSEP